MEEKFLFASRNAPKYKVKLNTGLIEFSDGVYEATPYEAEELRRMIATRPDVAQMVYEIDRARGQKLVEEHMKSRRPDAARGVQTSLSSEAQAAHLMAQDEMLKGKGTEKTDDAVQRLQEDGLMLSQPNVLPDNPVPQPDKISPAMETESSTKEANNSKPASPDLVKALAKK